jgi:hypothetical protein
MPRTTEATRLAIPVQNPHEIPEEKNSVFAERSNSTSSRGICPYITNPPHSIGLHSPLLGVGNALERSLGVLDNPLNGAGILAGLVLGRVNGVLVLLAGVVHEDASGLGGTDAEEQEVDRSEEQVAGLDDEAPASPDQTGGCQGSVLGE